MNQCSHWRRVREREPQILAASGSDLIERRSRLGHADLRPQRWKPDRSHSIRGPAQGALSTELLEEGLGRRWLA